MQPVYEHRDLSNFNVAVEPLWAAYPRGIRMESGPSCQSERIIPDLTDPVQKIYFSDGAFDMVLFKCPPRFEIPKSSRNFLYPR